MEKESVSLGGVGSVLGSLLHNEDGQDIKPRQRLDNLAGAQLAKQSKEQRTLQRQINEQKNILRLKEHVRPDAATDLSKERKLHKTATRGVVLLFNAIATQQDKKRRFDNSRFDSNKDRKKARSKELSKTDFLSMLKLTAAKPKGEESNESWDVLDDEFVHDLATQVDDQTGAAHSNE